MHARLAGALEAKAQQDPSILAGGASAPAAAAEEAPVEEADSLAGLYERGVRELDAAKAKGEEPIF